MRTKLEHLAILGLSLLCLATLSYSQAQTQSQRQPATGTAAIQYVGLKHGHILPRGLKHISGGLITDPYKDTTQFGLAHVTRGTTNMIWFELMTHHDAKGMAHWEVLDTVTSPTFRRNQGFMLTLCSFKGSPDPEIAALVQPSSRDLYELRVLKAWRANRQTRKFELIEAKDVKCESQADD
jgi:hypothetical protein